MSRLVNYGKGVSADKKVVGGLVMLGSAYIGVQLIATVTSFTFGTLLPIGVLGGVGYVGYRWLKSQR